MYCSALAERGEKYSDLSVACSSFCSAEQASRKEMIVALYEKLHMYMCVWMKYLAERLKKDR